MARPRSRSGQRATAASALFDSRRRGPRCSVTQPPSPGFLCTLRLPRVVA